MKLDLVPLDFGNLQLAIDVAIEIFGENDRPAIEQEFRGSLGILPERDILTKDYNFRDVSLFLCYKDGVPAGVTGYYNFIGHEEDMWLEWTGILPAHRGGGIGAQMVDRVFDIAASRFEIDNFRIWTTAVPEFDAARVVYAKMGFVEEPYAPEAKDGASLIRVFSKSAAAANDNCNRSKPPVPVSWLKRPPYPIDCEKYHIPHLNKKFGFTADTVSSPKKTGNGPKFG